MVDIETGYGEQKQQGVYDKALQEVGESGAAIFEVSSDDAGR